MTEFKDDIIDISAFMEKLLYPFQLLVKHYKLTILYIVIAIGLALVLRFTLPAVYGASFILKTHEKKDNFFISMLYDLQTLSKDKDYSSLASELNIKEELAESVSEIEGKSFVSTQSGDTSAAVSINLYMKRQDAFLELQNSIINYLDKSIYYQKLKKRRLNNLDSMRIRLKREIIEIDSVKKLVVENMKPPTAAGGGLVYNVPLDPFKAYEINLWHYQQQLELIKQSSNSSFELIKNCVVSKKPVWPRFKLLALLLIPLFLIVTMFHAHQLERKKKTNT